MKIYYIEPKYILSNENIFLSNENFYRIKIYFIEFCYISATILMASSLSDLLMNAQLATTQLPSHDYMNEIILSVTRNSFVVST